MGPTTRKPKARAQHLSIAIVSLAVLVPAAHAQVSASGTNAGMGDLNSANSPPTTRTPVLTYGVDAGVGESDNVTLVSSDKVSQTLAIADADFAVKEQTRLLEVNAKGNFSYLDYLQNAYSSQLLGRFDGLANVAIVPERLKWTVQDDFGQTALDPYTPVVPTNIEDVNYFSTGPDLTVRLGAINFINVSARYARSQYETSPYNSNRLLGNVAIGRDMSAGSTVSVNADTERVMFDNTVVNTDFDRSSGFLRYELHGARTDFVADLGATRVSQAGTSTNGSDAKVQLNRQLSAAAKFTFTAGRDLTDAASSFSAQQAGAIGIVGTAPPALTSNSYTRNYASVGWQYVRNRTTIAFTAKWEKDTYAGQPTLELTHPGAEFNVERRLTRAFTAHLLGRWYKTDYPNAVVAPGVGSSNFDDSLVGAALIWRHGRGLEIRMRYDHASHVVSEGNSGYTENRVFLTVGYRPRSMPELTEPP